MQRDFNSRRLRRRRHSNRSLHDDRFIHITVLVIVQSQLAFAHSILASHSRITTLSLGAPSIIGPKYICCLFMIIFVAKIKRAYSRDKIVVYRAGRVKLERPGNGS